MMKNLFPFMLMIVLFSAMVLGDCVQPASAAAPTQPRYGGTLKISRSFEVSSAGFTPVVKISDIYALWPCLQSLLKLDKDGNPSPNLAESWKLDLAGKTLTLYLRKGIKFHDGTELNAEAVKFNLTQTWIDANQPGVRPYIDSIDALDSYTVRLNLKKWGWGLLMDLSTKFGLMISPTAYKKNGGKDWAHTHPVGTGPFKLVEWDRDVVMKFEKFEDYWEKGKPYLDRIESYIIVDPMTQKASFLKGEQHILANVYPKDAAELAAGGIYRITKVPGQYHQISGDGGNKDSVWSNLKVRQAMIHAINSEAIAKSIGYGYWTPPPRNQMAVSGGWADNPDVKGYPYDPNKAKQLLAEAGYPNGFKTTLLCVNQPQYVVDFITAIQGQLRAVGIDATIDLMDPGREFKVQVGGGWKDGVLWVPNTFRNEAVLMHSMYNPTSVFHKSTIRPPDFQQKLEDALAAPNVQTMQKLLWEAQKMAVDTYAISNFLFVVNLMAAKSPLVHDDGLFEVTNIAWSPENAWIGK